MNPLPSRRKIEQIMADVPVRQVDTLAEAKLLCDYIGYQALPDVRMQVWDVRVLTARPLVLGGYVSNPWTLKALEYVCEQIAITCDTSRVITLPDAELGDHLFGLITSTECPLYSTIECEEQVDSAIMGEPIYLLRRQEEMSLVHSSNGYVGWVHNPDFRPIKKADWLSWITSDHAQFITAYSLDGIIIPGGASMAIQPTGEVCLPTGSTFRPIEGTYILSSPQNSQQRKALREVALTMLQTPYLWGGTTNKGIDCSGLVRYAYLCIGIYLPRDADQQFLTGRMIGLPGHREAVTTGDLLFFTGNYGGITHVAMALGPDEFIHASTQHGVCVTHFDKYPEMMRRFICAKRIIR